MKRFICNISVFAPLSLLLVAEQHGAKDDGLTTVFPLYDFIREVIRDNGDQ